MQDKTAAGPLPGYDASEAVRYHYGRFPPENLDHAALLDPLTRASVALGRYDQMLQVSPGANLLLGPLSRREALASSRMEGTISTLDAVLELETELDSESGDESVQDRARDQAFEVLRYTRALGSAQRAVAEGHPINGTLIRQMHETLLSYGRGSDRTPGEYKVEQNYIADKGAKKIQFIPIEPQSLQPAMQALMQFLEESDLTGLLKIAISHAEFEALHPFNDGNGRLGRMLITLMLSKYGVLHKPYFYISEYFDAHKDQYIAHMRSVSQQNEWTNWCIFFLEAVAAQCEQSLSISHQILSLHEDLKKTFAHCLGSRWSTAILDYMFASPVFRGPPMAQALDIPKPNINRFLKVLTDASLIEQIRPGAGRRAALYRLPSLLDIVR